MSKKETITIDIEERYYLLIKKYAKWLGVKKGELVSAIIMVELLKYYDGD